MRNKDHDKKLEEIHRREALKFNEDSDIEEEFDSDDSESEAESDNVTKMRRVRKQERGRLSSACWGGPIDVSGTGGKHM
jgi:hypothetical protein